MLDKKLRINSIFKKSAVFLCLLVIFPLSFFLTNILAGTKVHLSVAEKQWLSKHPILKIAPDPTFPPIEYFDNEGKYKGISAEYMHLIERKLNIKFEVVRCKSWDEVLDKAKKREVDILPAAAQTPDRAKYMDFSSAYLIFPGVIITRKKARGLDTAKKLYHKNVVIVSGYVWEEFISRYHPMINIVHKKNILTGLQDISLGEYDAMIATLPIAIYYIEKEGILNLRISGEINYFTKLSILSRNDEPILASILQKVLVSINPVMRKKIKEKWIPVSAGPTLIFETRLFWIIVLSLLSLSFIVFLMVFSWNKALKKIVDKRTQELKTDIAKRRQTEKKLKESEHQFIELFNNMKNGVAIYEAVDNGEDFILKNLNKPGCVTLQVVAKNTVGKRITKVFPGVKEFGLLTALQEVWKAGKPTDMPATFYQDKRLKGWYKNYIYKLPSGEVVAIFQDVTEQKKIENKIESLSKFPSENPNPILRVGTDANVLYINPSANLLFKEHGIECEHFIIENLKDDIEAAVKNNIIIKTEACAFEKIFEFTISPVLVFSYVNIYGNDITERKKAEKYLREKEEQLKGITNSVPGVIYQIYARPNGEYGLYHLSKQAKDVFGLDVETIGLKRIFAVFVNHLVPESRKQFIKSIDEASKALGPWYYEGKFISLEGREIYFEGKAEPSRNEKNEVIFNGILNDITERKIAEAEKKNLQSQIFQLQKIEAMGTMAFGVSHNFNNILAAVKGRIEMAREDIANDSRPRKDLESALSAIKIGEELIKQMSTFARKSKNERKKAEVVPLVKAAINMFRASIKSSVKTRESYSDDCGFILVEASEIQTVILNLVKNSYQSILTKGNDGLIEIDVSKVAVGSNLANKYLNLNEGSYVRIRIKDNGTGIEKEVLNRIYEPFFTTKEVGQGTGLGLSTAHSIISLLSGQIIVETKPGEGSIFDVYLPNA